MHCRAGALAAAACCQPNLTLHKPPVAHCRRPCPLTAALAPLPPPQAFDDCTTLTSTFKLLDSFEGLLERQVIAEDMDKKQQQLMRSYQSDIREALEIFESSKSKPNTARNSAPFSGSISWVRGLKERVQVPMGKLRDTYKVFLESEIGKDLEALHDKALAQMNDFEDEMIREWKRQVALTSDEKLNQPLLILLPEAGPKCPLITTNFDSALVRLLRETKYFLLLGIDVPESAKVLYSKSDVYRTQIGSLDIIASINNKIQKTILDVERPLVAHQMEVRRGGARGLGVKSRVGGQGWVAHFLVAVHQCVWKNSKCPALLCCTTTSCCTSC